MLTPGACVAIDCQLDERRNTKVVEKFGSLTWYV